MEERIATVIEPGDAERRNALAKERIKSLALDYACMFAYGTDDKTDKAWAEFLAAVDELAGAKC